MISYVRQAITTNGGTPHSFRLIDAWRELVTAYGGTPTSYRLTDLMRQAITAVGGTPTQRAEIPLLRELLTALGVSPVGYVPRTLYQALAITASGPSIVYTPALSPVPEGTTAGTLIGELSMLNPEAGTYTFTEETDASGKFSNNGTNGKDVRTAGTWDYDTATSYSVTYKADNGAGSVVYKTITVPVSNVLEVTLNALALDGLSFTEDAADSGSITGKTSGSTVTLVGSLPTGLTLDLTGMTWAWDGTGTLSDGSFTLRETHADSSNSPRDSVQAWEIVEASVTPTAIVAIAFGDSTWEGVIGPRDAGDTDWTGVYEVKVDNSLSSDITPMRRFAGPSDSLCPQEYWGKERHADTGLPIYMVQCAVGGSALSGTAAWAAPGGANLTDAVSRANAAIQAVIAAVDGPVQVEFTGDIGTNDGGSSPVVTAAEWFVLLDDMVDYLRSNIYQNGVSGATCADCTMGFVIPQPEWACIADNSRKITVEVRRMAGTKSNCVIFQPANGQTAGDNLHPTLVGARANGVGLANAFAETVSPTITFADFTIYSGQKLSREITADKIAWFTLSGADAAEFEIAEIAASTIFGGGDINAAQTKYYLRWAGNGDAPAAGTYNVTINAKGNASTPGTKNVVVTVAAAYGTQVETIVAPVWTDAGGFTDVGAVMVSSTIHFKRGLNIFSCFQVAGGAVMTTAVASNGLVGTADANNDGTYAQYYFYSAQDETVTVRVGNSGTSSANWCFNTNLVGTVTSPTASEKFNSATSASFTMPANGVGVVQGFSTGDKTPPAGQTALTCVGGTTDSAQLAGYRTTNGVLGVTSAPFAKMFASTWAKA